MRDDEAAAVEDVVTDEAVEERPEVRTERRTGLGRKGVDLAERLREAVRDLEVAAAELLQQLHVVVARDAEGRPRADHVVHDPERVQHPRTPVDDVPQEDHLAALGMRVGCPAGEGQRVRITAGRLVTEPGEQRFEFVRAAVDVADEVERAVLVAPVVPERHPLDHGGLDLLGAREDEHVPEPFPLQPFEGPAELRPLLTDDVGAERPVGAAFVAVVAEPFGEIEDDCDRERVVLAGDLHQRGPGFGLDVRGIDDGQPPPRKPLGRDGVQQIEGVERGGLVVLVIADEPAAGVGGEDFRRAEMQAGKRTFARAARADENDKREFRDRDQHRFRWKMGARHGQTAEEAGPVAPRDTARGVPVRGNARPDYLSAGDGARICRK